MRVSIPVIGIAGRAGAGKDTAADVVEAVAGFERIAFADPVRAGLAAMFDGYGIGEYLQPGRKEEPIPGLHGHSARTLMQTLGTEWGRDRVNRNIWTQALVRQVRIAEELGAPGVVIPDVRFPNEAYAVHSMGGEVWRIHASERLGAGRHGHRSELEVDLLVADQEVPNHRGLDEFRERVHTQLRDSVHRHFERRGRTA